MNSWGKIGVVVFILVLAGVGVAGERGPQLVRAGRAVVWYAPDNAARVLEAWDRPHILATALTHPPTVHWLRWTDRYTALREPVARRRLMATVGTWMGLGLLLGLLVALWKLAGPAWFLLRGVGRLRPGTTQGSARWATPREARHMYGPRSRGAPFVVGKVGHRRLWLSVKRQGLNVLAVGVPGEGKSTTLVIPNLLRETGQRSIVCSDPKGECHDEAAATLAGRGYTVQRLDFYDPTSSTGYNPMAHVRTASEALAFARTWIRNTRGQSELGASEEFWDSTAALLIQASVLHLNHIYRERTGHAAPLATLPALWNAESFDALKDELLHSPCAEAREAIRSFLIGLEMHGKLGGAVLVGLVVKFSVLNDPDVQKVTARDTLNFRVMGSGDPPVALFVTLTPGREEILQPLTGCLFTQMLDELVALANTQRRKALPRPVFCYMDEAGTIGVVDGLPKRLATLRSAGVGLLLAVQDTVQLDTLYKPEGRRIITSTAQTHIIFAGVGQEDAQWVSTRLGTSTVVGRGASAGRNRDELLVGQGGYNRSEVGRPLMTPEEVQQLPEGYMVVNALHARPVLVRTLPWYKDRTLRRQQGRINAAPTGDKAMAADAPFTPPVGRHVDGDPNHASA